MKTPKYWIFRYSRGKLKVKFVRAFTMKFYAEKLIGDHDFLFEDFIYNVETMTLKHGFSGEEKHGIHVAEIERIILDWMR
jgi:hypothetical protein